MQLHFTKMHGCGNDYVYLDCFRQPIPSPETLAPRLSDRHFGVGGDGIILIGPSPVADAQMRIFNIDGSEGKMCGNGIRCVAKYLYDHGYVSGDRLTVETQSGVKSLSLTVQDGKVASVKVDMGRAILSPAAIPAVLPGEAVVSRPVDIVGGSYAITCVSMGNPHCVLFWDADVDTIDLAHLGPQFEHSPLFPERINTEFCNILPNRTIKMRVWERGSGETLACGTGACASVVAAVENGFFQKGEPIRVQLAGGELSICYTDAGVTMQGPATEVFEGVITL